MSKALPGAGGPGRSLVPVIWFESISRWERRYGASPSSLFFHKIATLTRFRLAQQGIPVPLPYAWYLFGTAAQDLPHEVRIYDEPEAESTAVHWEGTVPDLYPGDRAADAIRETIDSLMDDYPPDKGERAVDEAYAHAPFEFQRRYRLVRISAGVTGKGSAEEPIARRAAGGLPFLLQDALDEFPYDRFPALTPSVSIVRETANLVLKSPVLASKHELAGEVIEAFWAAFCSHLRLDPEGHKDVSSQKLPHWRRFAERTTRHFERVLADIVVEVARLEPSAVEDATLGPVFLRREAEQAEEARLVDEGLAVLPERIISG